jgi:hypothetical protein
MKMAVFWVVTRVVWLKFTNVSEVLAASIIIIALIMDAASTSGTSVNFYQSTRHYNPEDSHLHTRRRENLNSYINFLVH